MNRLDCARSAEFETSSLVELSSRPMHIILFFNPIIQFYDSCILHL